MPTYRVTDSVTGTTLDVTGDSPPTKADLDKIFADFQSQQNNQAAIADSLADERTFLGQAGETLKAIPRGFANSFLSAGEGVAELSDAATNVVGLEDAIDSGDENALVFASREGRKLVDEYMGADEAYRDTWMTKFGEGIGSFASFFTPATIFRAAGIAGKGVKAFGGMGSREAAATGVLAAGQMSGDQAQRIQAARDAGITVSENQEDAAIVMSGFVGLSEMILPAMLLKKLAPDALNKLPGNTMEMLGSALRSGSVEGVQEVLAGITQNAIERGVYNEQAEVLGPTLYDDFTIGGAVGAGADLVLNAIAGRRNKNSFDGAAEAEGKAREDYEDQIELRSQLLTMDLELQERQDQEAALLESRRESDILLAGQQEVDSSQIPPPEGSAVSDKLRTASRLVNVVDETGQSFQAEEKTKVRNKGKKTETTVTYVEVPGGGEIVTSTRRLNEPAVAEDTGLQITTLSEGGGSLERRHPKHPMEAYAHHIRRVMGDNFPSADNSFSVNLPKGFEGRDRFGERIARREEATTQLEEGTPVFTVVDSIGQQFGVPLENANDAFALASYLNNEIINDNVFSGGEAIVASSPESYDEQQRKTLQFYNFAVNSPDANTYTSVAVNSAAETTQDRGFDEVADVRKLLDDGVDLSDMTASQRINAKRLRKGLAVTNKFTIEEVRDVLNNDQLYNLSDTRVNGLPETETYKAGFSQKGNPVVRSSAGETLLGRPLTIAEKESALEANPKKKPPKTIKFKTEADARAYANQLNNTTNKAAVDKGVMRNVDANYQEMENLLRAKNITSEVNSPEIKYLAGRILGRKKLTSRGSWSYANDLSVADARLLYEKLRQLPRFDKPTKLPFFELPKYTGAQFRAAVKELRNNPDANKYTLASATKINIATEEGDQALSDLRKAISDQGILSSQPEPIQAPGPIEPGKELVPFEQKPVANIERLRASLAKVMKGFGLSDVAVNLDFALNTAARTADGNLVYGVRRRREGDIDSMVIGGKEGSQEFVKADDIDPEGRAEAYYDDKLNTIFLSIDQVAADNSLTEEQIEANLLSVLDHEMIHAMRNLDLFTNKEFNLLTRAASKKLHPTDRDRNGNPQTFLAWATANYGQDFNRASVIEESVAELVRRAKADPKLLQGKPRSLVQRISRFFRNMVASLRGEQFNTFSEVMAGIEAGEIGGRSRGEIRTMYRTERDGRPVQAPQGAAQPTAITTGEEERGRVGQPRMADFIRRSVGAPETDVRPEVADAYRRMQDGEITREQYDTVVLGTISPYDFVPVPATYQEMFDALGGDKKSKVNVPIEDGTEVGLRLDIPAYTDAGVWVPTIHGMFGKDSKGKILRTSHRATASILNADFTQNKQDAPQRVMEGKVPGTEGFRERQRILEEIEPQIEEIRASDMDSKAKKKAIDKLKSRLSKFNKSTFARIQGSFVNRTDEETALLAEQAINDPAWTQVGFDPRRHSYFYDRKTGEPVTFAEEVIQVGPLVLAKNATKSVLPSGEQFETLYSRRPQLSPRRAPRLGPKRIPDSQVEEAVDQHVVAADQSLAGFIPRFNPGVDPYVQAVAADPSKGAVLSPEDRAMFSRANSPERPEKVQSAMDSMLVANPEDETPGDTYLNVLDQGPIGELLTRAKQGAVFQYAQIEAYENKFDREVLASSAAIPALMAADRSNAITAQSIANGVVVYKDGLTKVEDFEHTFTEGSDRAGETVSFRGLIDVMGMLFSKEHGSLEQDAQAYAIAKRAEGLRARGIDSPGSKEEHQLMIRNAEAYLDENGNSIIKDWYDAWQGYNSYTIKFLRDTGVLTEEMADIWAAQSDYVPFYRQAMGEDLTTIPNMFNNLTSKSTFKPIKGSEKQLNVPLLDAIVMNLSAAIDMGMKNVAQQRVVRNMARYGLSKEIQPGEPVDGRATVSFRVDGKDRKFTIEDPLVYQSLQPLTGGNGFDILETVLGKPANLLREMVTREPGFVLANMMRDTLSAYVTSGANFVPIFDTVAGFTKNMEDLERTGVVGGYDYSKDPKDIGKYLNNLLQERGFTENTTLGVARPFIGLWNFLGNVTTRSDFATRKAVYDDVLARTGDEAEAVFQAKEVMNFGRRGSHPVMRLLTTAIPFLNARLQGLDLLLNAARGKRNANKELDRGQAARSFIMRGATIAAATAMYYMMVSDEEQYKEQTEEIKDNFWIVPGPDGIAFRYPIPFEVGLLFKTIPERILRYATDDATARETAASLGRGVVSTLELNPFGVQAVAPLVEVLANYSAYRGRPITPVFVDQAEAAEFQDTVGTSELAKIAGQTLNVSPIKADYLVRGYTGTLGSYLLDMSDFVLRSEELKGDNRSVMPTLKLREYPVLKRFFTREFGGAEKERFYEMSNYINRFYNTYRNLYREGRTEELQRFSAGREHLLALRRDTEIVRRNLSALRRERAAILRLDISPEEKNSLVREINLRERYLLEVVPDLYKMADLPTIDVGSRLRAIGE